MSARRICIAISQNSISAKKTRSLNDGEMADKLLSGSQGKRLTYQQPRDAANA